MVDTYLLAAVPWNAVNTWGRLVATDKPRYFTCCSPRRGAMHLDQPRLDHFLKLGLKVVWHKLEVPKVGDVACTTEEHHHLWITVRHAR